MPQNFKSPVPLIRPCNTPNSAAPQCVKLTTHQLHQYLGFRSLQDYSILHDTASPTVKVVNTGTPPLELGDVAKIKKSRKGRKKRHSKHYLQDVYMDIGYGDGVAPQGFTHCLV